MRKLLITPISIFAALVLLLPANLYADEVVSREYKIKAAYLYNLIKFVNWFALAQSKMNAQGQTMICVYGHNPFASYLEKLSHRKAKGRGIKISYIALQDTPERCNVIFISEQNSERANLLNSSQIMGSPLLTVGENDSFVSDGGIVGLVVEDNSVQLQINLGLAKKAGFEISGNLLEIAEVIQ